MKTRCMRVALFLLLFPATLAFTQSREDFTSLVDFSLDLEALAAYAAEGGGMFPDDSPLVIVSGSVASRLVLRAGPEDYLAEIELLGGRWQGVESVATFRCIVQFQGPEYASFIPARRTRQASPDEIPLNATALVVGKPLGVRVSETGNEVVILGYLVRLLD